MSIENREIKSLVEECEKKHSQLKNKLGSMERTTYRYYGKRKNCEGRSNKLYWMPKEEWKFERNSETQGEGRGGELLLKWG